MPVHHFEGYLWVNRKMFKGNVHLDFTYLIYDPQNGSKYVCRDEQSETFKTHTRKGEGGWMGLNDSGESAKILTVS